ncbi:hypothetical protein ACLOAV_000819 [Pseudogymnoascus australis]
MNSQASGSPSPSRAAKRYRYTNIASTQLQMRAPRSDESKSSARRGSAISSSSLGLGLPLSSDGPLTSGTPSQPQLAPILDLEELGQDVEELDQSRMQLSSPRAAIQVVPAQARMLFDHFSKFIAAKMVVFDFTGNGYRQIVLPLACQDEMVGRAVSVIAAFHLAQEAPHMRIAAERGQQAILSRLCRDSLLIEPERLFSLSKWATVLVLLVGTTITGSDNFVYLLELLSCLARSSASVHSLSDTTRAFIMEQTRMFELFGFPLSSEEKGLKTLTRCPDYYLDFMLPCPSLRLNPAVYSHAMVMKDAIRQACQLYRNRALQYTASMSVTSKPCATELSIESVERLRQTVLDLEPSVDGCHALVWTYFVAAAESVLPEHRDFFSNRLRVLFECTRFGSIPLALETLQHIWATQSSSCWIEIVTHQRPLLIM